MNPFFRKFCLWFFLLGGQTCFAQSTNILGQSGGNNTNVVSTAVPFLLIAPDARANGIGGAGVASSPDANSTYWNPSKLAFTKDTLFGMSISYAPWLRQLVPDINLAYLSAYYRLDTLQVISGSLKYFSLGNIQVSSGSTVTVGNFNPNEYAVDFNYSRKISRCWSLAITARYIYSNLTGTATFTNTLSLPGRSFGADISAYYQKGDIHFLGIPASFAFGANMSNIGPKIRYSPTAQSAFLPANLRTGSAVTLNLDKNNKLTFLTDLNKLLVPTPPIYATGPSGTTIVAGRDPNVSVLQGIVQSFYDAPGGLQEEINEITVSLGTEYWYANEFAARAGLFYESASKGGRQYISIGAGFKLHVLTIDAAYIIPLTQQNPLQNTLCISMSFYFNRHLRKIAPPK